MAGIVLVGAVYGYRLVFVFVIDLRLIGECDRDQIAIFVIFVFEPPPVRRVSLNDVPIKIEIESKKTAVAALDPTSLPKICFGRISAVVNRPVVAPGVLPLNQEGTAVGVNIREPHYLESSQAPV